MTYQFSPGSLKNKKYCDKKLRVFETVSVWSGYPNGEVVSVDLLETATEKLHKLKIETFKDFIINKQLIQV